MERHQHAVVQILSHLGLVWVYASHNPELLTTSRMVFGRERPTFGDETIYIASYCFQIVSRVNIEQQECWLIFCDFSGFAWTFLYINWVYYAFMCIIQIWTTCTCSNAYKLVENSYMCPWGLYLCLMQEMRMKFEHHGTVAPRQTSTYLLL